MVGRPELERGQPHVVMAVDEPGKHDVLAGAEHLVRVMPGRDVGERSDLDDPPVLLVDGALRDHVGHAIRGDGADDVLAVNQRRGHARALLSVQV